MTGICALLSCARAKSLCEERVGRRCPAPPDSSPPSGSSSAAGFLRVPARTCEAAAAAAAACVSPRSPSPCSLCFPCVCLFFSLVVSSCLSLPPAIAQPPPPPPTSLPPPSFARRLSLRRARTLTRTYARTHTCAVHRWITSSDGFFISWLSDLSSKPSFFLFLDLFPSFFSFLFFDCNVFFFFCCNVSRSGALLRRITCPSPGNARHHI